MALFFIDISMRLDIIIKNDQQKDSTEKLFLNRLRLGRKWKQEQCEHKKRICRNGYLFYALSSRLRRGDIDLDVSNVTPLQEGGGRSSFPYINLALYKSFKFSLQVFTPSFHFPALLGSIFL